MIEVFLFGDYLDSPHEIGAWAYLIRQGDELLAQGKGIERPQVVTSRLATETAALALALEDLVRDWDAQEVTVYSRSAGLAGLLVRRGEGVARDVARWYERVRGAADGCAHVRILRAQPDQISTLQGSVKGLLPATPGRILVARASEVCRRGRARP